MYIAARRRWSGHWTNTRNSLETKLSLCRVAKRLNVSERTARRLIEAGDLKAYRIGRQWRVFESDLQEYLAKQANRHRRRRYTASHDAGGAAACLAVEAATGTKA